MKRIVVILLLCGPFAFSQVTTLFHEDFDAPSGADSILIGTPSSGVDPWQLDSSLFTNSGEHCLRVSDSAGSYGIYFETNPFSTVGNPYVELSFDHIAKIGPLNSCNIFINHGGSLWTSLPISSYLGNSGYSGHFNETSYSQWGDSTLWQNAWVKEKFDLTGIASDTNSSTFTGYPYVRLRFEANFSQFSSGIDSGWFVDNVKVKAGTCELNPPIVSFDFSTPSCYEHNPNGRVSYNPNDSYAVGVKASDDINSNNSGIDSVALYYSINGNLFIGVNMPPTNINNEYKGFISGLNVDDSVQYFIIAYDNGCPNSTRLPDSSSGINYYTFVVEPAISAKCIICAGSYPKIISNFPWTETFEGIEWIAGNGSGVPPFSHRGTFPIAPDNNWEVIPAVNNTFGWSIISGATYTGGTGPSSDHTSGGGKYIYMESTSTGGPSTFLTTPCIDLTDSVGRFFSFYYHMYGADINKFNVDIDTGASTSQFYNAYFQLTGEQQTSSTDSWKKAYLDLSPFKGKYIRIRFRYTELGSSSSDLQDIAIDDLHIDEYHDTNLVVTEIKSPENFKCSSAPQPVIVSIQNMGSKTLTSIPMAYQVGNAAVVRDTFTINPGLNTNDTASFTFSQPVSFPAIKSNLKVWSELANDPIPGDDTLQTALPEATSAIDSFPYYEDFEEAIVASAGNNGMLSSTQWILNSTDNGANGARWEVAQGYLKNTAYGPETGIGKEQKYLVCRSGQSSMSEYATFESGCLDLSSLSIPKLSFYYFIAGGATLEVTVVTHTGQYITVKTLSGSLDKDPMTLASVDLISYINTAEKIIIRAGGASSNDYFAAIDNIEIIDQSEWDLSLSRIQGFKAWPYNIGTIGPSINIGVRGGNYSYSGVFKLSLDPLCDTTSPVTFTSANVNILGNADNKSVTPTFNFSPVPRGDYLAKLWLEITNDNYHFNDTIYYRVTSMPLTQVPYFQDFDSCIVDFSVPVASSYSQWEVAEPDKPGFTGAHSGSRAAITNATDTIPGIGNEYLISPFFEGLDTLYGCELRIYHKYDFSPTGYGIVQYLKNGNWQNLTSPSVTGTNWFSKMQPKGILGYAFVGNTSQWEYSSYPLDAVTNSVTAFRFVCSSLSNNNVGWAIDDFEIFVPKQNSASPMQLFFNGLPQIGNNSVDVKIKNTSNAPLSDVKLTIYAQGITALSETVIFNPPIISGASATVSLTNPLAITAGTHQLYVVTSDPNTYEDQLPTDDTLVIDVGFLKHYNDPNQCFDLEGDEELLSYNFHKGYFDTVWAYGTPAKTNISGTPNGSKAWYVDQSENYSPLINTYLYTPVLALNHNTCYKLSFQHNYDTEKNFDGGHIEYSLDSGSTWQVLGNYGDSIWYNTVYVQSLSQVLPGFSGSSGGWVKDSITFRTLFDGNLQLRFRFASNADISGNGWAVDDICIEEITGACQLVGVTEEVPVLTRSLELFPNPAHEEIHFVTGQYHSKAVLQIRDQQGKVLREWRQTILAGSKHPVDISHLSKGMYWLSLEGEAGTGQHVKFIKN